MRPVADAIFERKITSAPLPLIPFSEWFEKVESSAKNASEANIKRVVSVFHFLTEYYLTWSSILACYQASQLYAFDVSIRYRDQSVWGNAHRSRWTHLVCDCCGPARQSNGERVGASVVGDCNAMGGLLGGSGNVSMNNYLKLGFWWIYHVLIPVETRQRRLNVALPAS